MALRVTAPWTSSETYHGDVNYHDNDHDEGGGEGVDNDDEEADGSLLAK